MEPERMRLLFDQNVPQAVVDVFKARGHEIVLSREWLNQDSPDQLIAFAGELEGLIVVSVDADFRRYHTLFPQGFRNQATRMIGRIAIKVSEVRAANRVEQVMDAIEMNYAYSVRRGVRFFLTITETNVSLTDNARNP